MITNEQILEVIKTELSDYIDLDGVDIQINYDKFFKIKDLDISI